MTFSKILIPFTVMLTLTFLLHRYIWLRMVRDVAWTGPWGKVFTIAIFTLAALVPLVFLTMRTATRSFAVPFSWVVYTWMGFLLYLFVFSVLSDMGKGASHIVGIIPQDPERRRFVARGIAMFIGTAAGAVGLTGMYNVARGFTVKRIRVPIAKLPQSASGYSIVQLTDVHVGPTIGRKFVESMVAETNALNPDMIVITGDMVDGSVANLSELVEPLRDLKAKDGVFFVTGNHEYYSGADEWIAHIRTLGIRVLRNERVDVRGAFDLVGVDDASARNMLPDHGMDIEGAVEGRDVSKALVLLAHQPKAFSHALKAGVDLQLSGHVHGGQMIPFNWLAHIDQPFIADLHRVENTWIYVSAGTGYWGPPMRVGTQAEITWIELISSSV